MIENRTAQIVNATPGQLIVITYELIIETLEEAQKQLAVKDEKKFKRTIDKAQKLLRELMESLDLSYSISLDLMGLYLYINKMIIKSYITLKEEPLEEAKKLLNTLLIGWKEAVASEEVAGPVIENAQQIYAGLTYGKGSLNESIMENANRGFKA
ncbi:flagellar export chaperone FliS [Defluviitalea raffinosedens]|uniref:flagellar export chaperone FliS n=1 Tax=Defluviitalea raffinosedens TaxID=1450156 RepID=UPI0019597EA7|nr:flagellar export chaperone FliS [Defluviitalea raffinosedens]MBM7686005.1 flagellar protein FliS [Defluviitalea raffinosedens]